MHLPQDTYGYEKRLNAIKQLLLSNEENRKLQTNSRGFRTWFKKASKQFLDSDPEEMDSWPKRFKLKACACPRAVSMSHAVSATC